MKDVECCSPALSITSDMTDEELDKYFASYEPLSNLPTPPPAKEAAMPDSAYASTSTASTRAPSPTRDLSSHPSEIDVYATHLANLVPFNVSTRRPQHSLIRGFLERAYLPDEFVAMSACILDALSTRFATTWREALAPSDQVSFMHQDFRPSVQVAPDVIVLAALSLAHGFLADRLRSCRRWASKEGGNAFTLAQLEATKRAILQDMDYGLFRISEDRVQRRLRAMQLAVANSTAAAKMACTATTATEKPSRRRELSLSFSGAAMWSHGMSTPEPSP